MLSWTDLDTQPYLCAAFLRSSCGLCDCKVHQSQMSSVRVKVLSGSFKSHKPKLVSDFIKRLIMQSSFPLPCWIRMSWNQNSLISLNHSQILFSSILMGSWNYHNVVSTSGLAMMITDSLLINQLLFPFLLLWSHLFSQLWYYLWPHKNQKNLSAEFVS